MRDSVEQVMKPLIEMEDKDVARLFSELGDNPFLAVLGALPVSYTHLTLPTKA